MWFINRKDKSIQDSEIALRALREARKNLKKIEERGEEVTEIAHAFREFQDRNHFAEQMEALLLRRRGRAT